MKRISSIHDHAFLVTLTTSLALAQAVLPPTEGEVRKVDKEAGKVTLKHGEIKNLEMPGMTMVFQVKDPALLEKVKASASRPTRSMAPIRC
jgi:Cu(I)/Ag(I) efflux system protein CusF